MIYIVEDDASIRELEQYALQTNQYTVRGFEDGASFWAAVRETVPDLVILDVMLPDEDGYQILGRLRETAATRTVPVIMVTAKTSEIDVVKGLTTVQTITSASRSALWSSSAASRRCCAAPAPHQPAPPPCGLETSRWMTLPAPLRWTVSRWS